MTVSPTARPVVALEFPAGATVLASGVVAWDLCSTEEQALLRSLQCRYFESPPAMARRKRDVYPIMDPAGLRPLHPPPGLEPECATCAAGTAQLEEHQEEEEQEEEEQEDSSSPDVGGRLPEYARRDRGVKGCQSVASRPVEPLVWPAGESNNGRQREAFRCNTVCMRRLKPLGQTAQLPRDPSKLAAVTARSARVGLERAGTDQRWSVWSNRRLRWRDRLGGEPGAGGEGHRPSCDTSARASPRLAGWRLSVVRQSYRPPPPTPPSPRTEIPRTSEWLSQPLGWWVQTYHSPTPSDLFAGGGGGGGKRVMHRISLPAALETPPFPSQCKL